MNREAERHLVKAEGYLGRGEEFYRKAGQEILLARAAGATWTEIGDRLDRSKSWCQKVSDWAETAANGGSSSPLPYSGEAPAINLRKARQILREAPMEEVEKIVADLPQERRAKIERAIVETHPALQKKPPIGVGDSIRRMEANTSFVMLMGGALSVLGSGVRRVSEDWEKYSGNATEEEKEIVQEQIRDEVASLLAINSDPQELLR